MSLAEQLEATASTRWTNQWKELKAEVIDAGLCTGCAGLRDLVSPRRDRLRPRPGRVPAVPPRGRARPGRLHPRREGLHQLHPGLSALPALGGPGRRAPLRPHPPPRRGRRHLRRHPADPGHRTQMVHEHGPGRRPGLGDPALGDGARLHRRVARVATSRATRTPGRRSPGVAATRDEVLAAAGSRYTYSANTLALDEALEAGHSRLALVGMSCQSSVPPVMWSRKIGKISKPIVFNLGLLCSKTFDDAIFEELFRAKYGLERSDIVKMNIKGVFQIWTGRRQLPRGQPQGVPRLDPRGLHALPRLRRRARRHLLWRHRRERGLDPHHRPHRPGPRDHQSDDRRRVDRVTAGRLGPRRDRADAQALGEVAGSLAGRRRAERAGRTPGAQTLSRQLS